MSWEKEVDELARKRALAQAQGGEEGVSRQHARGLLTIRERIDAMLDDGSFQELGGASGEAIRDEVGRLVDFKPANFVLGFGTIDGCHCVIGGEDFTLSGGSPNEAGLRKSVYAEELACTYRVPLVRLHQGAGGSVAGTGSKTVGTPVNAPPRFASVAQAMASVPVASAGLGAVAGLPAARLVASHFSVMAENSQVLVAGPAVVERALGRRPSKEALGGPEIHARNGVIDNLVADEPAAFAEIRRFLSYLPPNVWELPPCTAADDPAERRAEELIGIVPRNRRKLYDMRRVIALVLDEGSFFEIGRLSGQGTITGLARLMGQPVGVLANDCWHLAGAMTAAGSQKTRRFIELCDTFHLPIVSPGGRARLHDRGRRGEGRDHPLRRRRRAGGRELRGALGVGDRAQGARRRCRGALRAGRLRRRLAFGRNGGAPGRGRRGGGLRPPNRQGRRPRRRARAPGGQEMLARQSPEPRAESFSFHDLIDPRETRPVLCDWIARVQPLLERLKGPTSFPVRP